MARRRSRGLGSPDILCGGLHKFGGPRMTDARSSRYNSNNTLGHPLKKACSMTVPGLCRKSAFVLTLFALSSLVNLPTLSPAQAADAPQDITFGEALILAPPARAMRVAFPIDPVAAQIADGTWAPPKAGDTVPRPDGRKRAWQKLAPGKDGSYQDRALNGGYAFFSLDSPADRVMVLEASGHGMVWVNGEPRAGDPYSYGYVHVPVQLKKGANLFLFTVARGELKAKLPNPPGEIFFKIGR